MLAPYAGDIPWIAAAARPLPGVQRVSGSVLLRGADYARQMSEKRDAIGTRRGAVIAVDEALGAGVLEALYPWLLACVKSDRGYRFAQTMQCPDGVAVSLDPSDPLGTLGQLVQEDICVLERRGDQHVLTAALLTFPAGWTLAEKIGRPLERIHKPVPDYPEIARRVQRLFDGVQEGRPIWRANALWYRDDALFAPMLEAAPRAAWPEGQGWLRSERQVIARIPGTQAVVFLIRTGMAPAR